MSTAVIPKFDTPQGSQPSIFSSPTEKTIQTLSEYSDKLEEVKSLHIPELNGLILSAIESIKLMSTTYSTEKISDITSKYVYIKFIAGGFSHDPIVTERILKKYNIQPSSVNENYDYFFNIIRFYLYYMTIRFRIYLVVYIYTFLLTDSFSDKILSQCDAFTALTVKQATSYPTDIENTFELYCAFTPSIVDTEFKSKMIPDIIKSDSSFIRSTELIEHKDIQLPTLKYMRCLYNEFKKIIESKTNGLPINPIIKNNEIFTNRYTAKFKQSTAFYFFTKFFSKYTNIKFSKYGIIIDNSESEKDMKIYFPYTILDLLDSPYENEHDRYLFLFLSLHTSHNGAHANLLVFDKKKKKIIHIEPNGSLVYSDVKFKYPLKYNYLGASSGLKLLFNIILPTYEYVPPSKLNLHNLNDISIENDEGFCKSIQFLYLYMIMYNSKYDVLDIINMWNNYYRTINSRIFSELLKIFIDIILQYSFKCIDKKLTYTKLLKIVIRDNLTEVLKKLIVFHGIRFTSAINQQLLDKFNTMTKNNSSENDWALYYKKENDSIQYSVNQDGPYTPIRNVNKFSIDTLDTLVASWVLLSFLDIFISNMCIHNEDESKYESIISCLCTDKHINIQELLIELNNLLEIKEFDTVLYMLSSISTLDNDKLCIDHQANLLRVFKQLKSNIDEQQFNKLFKKFFKTDYNQYHGVSTKSRTSIKQHSELSNPMDSRIVRDIEFYTLDNLIFREDLLEQPNDISNSDIFINISPQSPRQLLPSSSSSNTADSLPSSLSSNTADSLQLHASLSQLRSLSLQIPKQSQIPKQPQIPKQKLSAPPTVIPSPPLTEPPLLPIESNKSKSPRQYKKNNFFERLTNLVRYLTPSSTKKDKKIARE